MPLTADPLTTAADVVADIIEATPAPKRRGTLLVVDDEDGPRMSLRVIFKDEYDILMAEDGPAAIELAQKNDIDVAVLDIRMAGMTGVEQAHQIAQMVVGHDGVLPVRDAGVGSNRTQPVPAKYSSGQACASCERTTYDPSACFSPGRNPMATRAGMPLIRAISAIVAANCSQ